ncbi:mechanosensitive ion channel family protein [Picosynechococcus sp. PCC 7117]|uniref:mechanosensitive ion channel family protein n=1 Tax=Picosynechococcus sp. PCC 7117 TaxID=195498 RepID=UPI0008109958|nr:mechanosensitive ion channel family protein [Picosynechococcus sp. PCC 7117]ANV86415.1 mechanosensitive ion channel protein MscS [Picosynechococcus sp. PCC 7117]
MSQITETIINSLQAILSIGIQRIPGLLTGIIILFLTRYCSEIFQKITKEVTAKTIKNHSLQILADKGVYVGTWVLGVLFACVVAFPGLSLGDIVATLGVGSIAIGFAFQDIVKNFFAGIILLVEEPFRIGDEIAVSDYQGIIEDISIRTTSIRTYQGEKVLLPNASVFTDAVMVKTAYPNRRTDLGVGVDYNTPLPMAKDLLQQTICDLDGVLAQPAPEIDLVSFGDSSIDFIVRYWTMPKQKEVRRVQTLAIIKIKEVFDAADINIPYPIRTLYYYNQDKYNDYLPSQLPAGDDT